MSLRKDEIHFDLHINGEQITDTFGDLKKKAKQLRRELNGLKPGTEAFVKKAKELAKVEDQIKGVKTQMKSFRTGQAKAAKGFLNIGKLAGALGPIMLAVFSIQAITEFAQHIAQIAGEFNELRETVNAFSGESGDALNKTTAKAKAMADTFDVDVNEILEATNAASAEFGIGFDEALNLVQKGLLATKTKHGDYIAQISEYSTQFKDMGYTAEEAFAIISQGQNMGVFSDKAPDAIKEFKLRLNDLTKAQHDLIKDNFGEKFAAQIADGSLSSIDALKGVSQGMRDIKAAGGNLQPIITNLFGGAGEDAGERYLLSLADIDTNLDNLIDTGNIFIQQKQEEMQAQEDLNLEYARLGESLQGVGHWFKMLWNTTKLVFFRMTNAAISFFRFWPEKWGVFKEQAKNSMKSLYNYLIGPIEDALNYFRGLTGLAKVDLKADIDTSGLDQAKENLKSRLEQNQKEIEAYQVRKTMESAGKVEEANRVATLNERAKSNKEYRKRFKEDQEKLKKEVVAAAANIERLRIASMEEGKEKEIALRKLRHAEQISKLKGNASQIREQTRLLEEQKRKDLLAIQDKYDEEEEKQEETKSLAKSHIAQKRFERDIRLLEERRRRKVYEANLDVLEDVKAGKSVEEVEANLKDRLLGIEKDYFEDKKSLQQGFLKEQIQNLKSEAEERKNAIADSDKDVANKRLEIEIDLQNQIAALQADFTSTKEAILNQEIDQEKAAADKRLKIRQETKEKLQNMEAAMLSSVKSALDAWETFSQNSADKRLNALEARKAKELKLAGGNEARKAKIEKKYNKEREKIETAQNERSKKIAKARALVNTYESVTKTYAQFGFPWGIPAAAAAFALGIANVMKIEKSMAEGGPTGKAPFGTIADSSGEKPIGLIRAHEHEWIAPRWMVQSPQYGPLIQEMEGIRIRGYAEGGFPSSSPTPSARIETPLPSESALLSIRLLEEVSMKQSQIIRLLSNPQFVTIYGEREYQIIDEGITDLNKRIGGSL